MVPNCAKHLIRTFSDCMKYTYVLSHLTIGQNDAGINPPFKYQKMTNQIKNTLVDHSNCDIIDYLNPISYDDDNNFFLQNGWLIKGD